MTRFSVAKDLVITNLSDIVPELFGHGKKQTQRKGNGSWQVANKWRSSADLSEMKVYANGGWKDFTNGDAGDAMDLVAYGLTGLVKNREARMQALEWVENRFGIRTMDPGKLEAIKQQSAARRQDLDEAAARDRHDKIERARKAFFGAQREIAGTKAQTYLRWRGIDIGAIPNLAVNSFRYRGDCDYWPATEFGASKADRAFPGLLSAMVDGAGKLGAVHYTLFEPDGQRKLDTLARGWVDEKPDGRRKGKSAKLMFPETTGLVVRVTRGPSGLNCEAAAAQGLTGWAGITEGMEDALSVGMSDPDLRMHAAGSLSGYLHVPDHACIKGYLIFRDNDWDKPQAVELFDRALARFKSFGKPVTEVAMPAAWGKDTNDVLNWKG